MTIASKELALLILLVSADAPLHRTTVAKLLWPSSSPKSSKHSLSQALYKVRETLGKDVVAADRETLQLGSVESDVARFQRAIQHGDHEAAAAAYRGEFAHSVSLPGLVHFEHILDQKRATFHEKAVRLLAEPLAPSLRRDLMRSLGLAEPAVDTGDGEHPPPKAGGFVGRSDELALLESAWLRSCEGGPVTVIVEGEPGIGKTALCSRFLRRTVLRGAKALEATAFELEANLPFGVVGRLLAAAAEDGGLISLGQPWKSILATLHPSLLGIGDTASDPGDPSPQRVALAFQQALTVFASANPVSIFVDDVQWADPVSMSVLHYIGNQSRDSSIGVLLLLSRRTPRHDTKKTFRWPGATLVKIGGLSAADVEYLVLKRGESIKPDVVQELYVLSQGNPLLINALLDSGYPATSLPPTAQQYFHTEIRKLSGDAILVGAALSAAGTPLDSETLAWIADLDNRLMERRLQELIDHKYVESTGTGERYSFRHSLMAEVFADAVAPAVRATMHNRAGRLLLGTGHAPAVVAAQFAIAGSAEEAFEAAMTAAAAGERLHAFQEAEHFYRIAVAHSGTSSQKTQAVRALADLLLQQSRPAEAAELIRHFADNDGFAAAEGADLKVLHLLCDLTSQAHPPAFLRKAHEDLMMVLGNGSDALVIRALIHIAANAVEGGKKEIARQVLSDALTNLDQLEDGPDRTTLEVRIHTLSALLGRPGETHFPTEALLERVGNSPAAQTQCLLAGGVSHFLIGDIERAENYFLRAMGILERFALADQRIGISNNLGVTYLEQGRWEEADRQFQIALAAAQFDSRREVLSTISNIAILRWETEKYQEAIQMAMSCVDKGSDHRSTRTRFLGLAVLGLAQLATGKLSEARAAERELRISLPIGQWWGNDISYPEIFLARIAIIDGRTAEAENRLKEQIEFASSLDYYCAARLKTEMLALQCLGNPEETLIAAEELRYHLARAKAVPLVIRIDGIIARCRSHILG